ncbi:vWA domain-containing protein [Brevundimonas sp.]|uniref:vWA domain-containing protein n=1 Tax=Brevundimonas sp. TaxID=1871086 RepID=UPI003F71C207
MRIRSMITRSAVALLLASTALTVISCTTATAPHMPAPAAVPAPPPPPPPPAPSRPAVVGVEATDLDEVVVSGSRIRREGDAEAAGAAAPDVRTAASTPVAPTDRGTRPAQPRAPQAGLLTAGDYDDLLNPSWYADYVSRYLQEQGQGGGDQTLPWVDTREAITIAVRDRDGRPAPFVEVWVSRPQAEPLRLRTLADGTVVVFPGLDRLGRTADISVAGATRRLTVGPDRRLEIRTHDRAAAVRAFDLLMVIDATGSMGDEMEYLKREIASIMASLAERHPGVDTRIGLVVYRDNGDQYVVRDFPFTGNVDELVRRLEAQRADGGGDYPEAVDQALERAMDYPWREDAVRSLVLVADAPPHDDRIAATWEQVQDARARRIQITPVAASGVGHRAEFVMRAAAAATQSRYLFLTDDSGVGNRHATPEVKCYVVSRLDSLLRRVLDSQISGRRIEPTENEVIRTVGPYDRGVCGPK